MSENAATDATETIGAVLARIPSGLSILTVRSEDGRETGMLASWVQQAAFDPPAVTVAVNHKRYLKSWIAETSRVALSLVGETQKALLGHFGRGFDPDEPAFEGLNLARTATGLPVLADALGWLAGTIEGRIDAGDHAIYLVTIQEAGRGENIDDERPWVHLRKNGLNY